MVGASKPIIVDLSDFSGGMNTADPDVSLPKNQCQRILNLMVTKIGAIRVKGFLGLKSTAVYGSAIKGLHVYEKLDGTEILLGVGNAKCSVVDPDDGSLSDIFASASGQSEAWFSNALDKCFVCDGKAAWKVESATAAYGLGIAPPAGVAAAAAAGGSLPDGVYKIYAGYARRISGVDVLYSTGQVIADVTLGSGNNTIAVTSFANSSDAQVGNKVIWMTDADGAVYYLYHSTGNNTTTSFNITDATGKNAALLYTVQAASNYTAPAFTYLHYFDRRIWGVVGNRLYYSLKGSVYDLERFDTANNFIDYPFTIISVFDLNGNLYINTTGGMIIQPNGDVTAKYILTDSRYYFKFPRTIDFYMGQALGVTNDGLRFFDGEKFSDFDYSKDIKPEIDSLYSGASATFWPCGKIYRRSFRTEYHLSFRDLNYGDALNSRHFVLNLSSLVYVNANEYQTPWEEWAVGCSHIATTKGNTIYYAQTLAASGTVFKEQVKTADQYIYLPDGSFVTSETNKYAYLKTRQDLQSLSTAVRWKVMRFYAQIMGLCRFKVSIGDNYSATYESTLASVQPSALEFDVGEWDANMWAIENAAQYKKALPWTIKGKGLTVEFWQTANDPAFKLLRVEADGEITRSRFS